MTKIHNKKPFTLSARIMPFLILGIALVLFIFSLIVFWWIFVLGIIIGLIGFLIAYIREKFFHRKHTNTSAHTEHGRIIEHKRDED